MAKKMAEPAKPVIRHMCTLGTLVGYGGKLAPEFLDWLEFAERVIACWLEKATLGREMIVCPEQIPPGYYLSVFGDRWKDVSAIKEASEAEQQRHTSGTAPSRPHDSYPTTDEKGGRQIRAGSRIVL